jgi:hypothetical protein
MAWKGLLGQLTGSFSLLAKGCMGHILPGWKIRSWRREGRGLSCFPGNSPFDEGKRLRRIETGGSGGLGSQSSEHRDDFNEIGQFEQTHIPGQRIYLKARRSARVLDRSAPLSIQEA